MKTADRERGRATKVRACVHCRISHNGKKKKISPSGVQNSENDRFVLDTNNTLQIKDIAVKKVADACYDEACDALLLLLAPNPSNPLCTLTKAVF